MKETSPPQPQAVNTQWKGFSFSERNVFLWQVTIWSGGNSFVVPSFNASFRMYEVSNLISVLKLESLPDWLTLIKVIRKQKAGLDSLILTSMTSNFSQVTNLSMSGHLSHFLPLPTVTSNVAMFKQYSDFHSQATMHCNAPTQVTDWISKQFMMKLLQTKPATLGSVCISQRIVSLLPYENPWPTAGTMPSNQNAWSVTQWHPWPMRIYLCTTGSLHVKWLDRWSLSWHVLYSSNIAGGTPAPHDRTWSLITMVFSIKYFYATN